MRDKLIDILCAFDGIGNCRFKTADCKPCEELADFLISHGVTVQQWIPVSERLPEKSGKYLVRYELWGWGKLFSQWTGLCFFYDEISQFIDDGGPVMGRITHWMPLPEAPKEVT